jgi:hypothetical protein
MGMDRRRAHDRFQLLKVEEGERSLQRPLGYIVVSGENPA